MFAIPGAPDYKVRRVLDGGWLETEVDAGPFPELGLTDGDFELDYPARYPDLRWEREVVTTPVPDVREVRVRVFRSELESGDDVTLTYYVRRR